MTLQRKRTPEEERAFALRVAETVKDTIDFETDPKTALLADASNPPDWDRALNAYAEGMAMARYSKGDVSQKERDGLRKFADACFEARHGITPEAYARQCGDGQRGPFVEGGGAGRYQRISETAATHETSQDQHVSDVDR